MPGAVQLTAARLSRLERDLAALAAQVRQLGERLEALAELESERAALESDRAALERERAAAAAESDIVARDTARAIVQLGIALDESIADLARAVDAERSAPPSP